MQAIYQISDGAIAVITIVKQLAPFDELFALSLYPTLSYPIPSYPILSYPILPYPTAAYPILSHCFDSVRHICNQVLKARVCAVSG